MLIRSGAILNRLMPSGGSARGILVWDFAKTLTVTGRKAGSAAGSEAEEPATITVPLVGFPQTFDLAMALGGR